MAFGISSAISAARARFKSAYDASSGVIRSLLGSVGIVSSPRGIVHLSQSGLEDAGGITGALLKVSLDGSMSRAVADELGRAAVTKLRQAVDPISRTGTLRDSFRSEKVGDSVIVYSTAAYAKAITNGPSMDSPPSAEDLMDWMATKPEFAGLDPKAARRVAFAIRTSIKTGAGSGRTGRSDIRRLSPGGERAYDFVAVALEQLAREIDTIGFEVIREVTGGA